MTTPRKAFRWINRALPLVISITSLLFSGVALRNQTDQSKMQLWHDFRREFDRDLKPERKAFGLAFEQGNIKDEYDDVMTFFETVGFLVRTGRMDEEVFGETFSYDFVAYFKACKPMMDEERAEDTQPEKVWQNVYDLAREYHDDPLLNDPEKLKAYFDHEKDLPER
jgi:hypothetical protein